ncbi:MAG: hypothetical protein AAF219_09970 [Myxococcota bacterium]
MHGSGPSRLISRIEPRALLHVFEGLLAANGALAETDRIVDYELVYDYARVLRDFMA